MASCLLRSTFWKDHLLTLRFRGLYSLCPNWPKEDFSSFSCSWCSFHSSFYDNCSDTICIYENHINFTRASGIPYKSIFFTFVDHRKQQHPFAHRKQKENFAPVLIRKAQWHTFWHFHIFPLLFGISLKEDFILLTQQILFSLPKGKAEKMMPYPHPYTKAFE